MSEARFGRLMEERRRSAVRQRVSAAWSLRGVGVDGDCLRTDLDLAHEAALEVEIERVGEDRVVVIAHVVDGERRLRVACVEARLGEGAEWVIDSLGMTNVDVASVVRLSASGDGVSNGYAWTSLIQSMGVKGGRSRLRSIVVETSD